MSIAVIYLARLAEGLEPLRHFAESYRRHPAGARHRLVVLYKANDWALQDEARAIFKDIPHQALAVSDSLGVDIDAYRFAVRQLHDERFCFLNTFSEIMVDNWLAKFDDNLTERTGIVGATGSYEALLDSLRLFSKVVWLCANKSIAYDPTIAHHFEDILVQHAPWWIRRPRPMKALSILLRPTATAFEKDFPAYWDSIASMHGVLWWYLQFPRFPNPHIRSNAFMLRRVDALRYLEQPVILKENASIFESGRDSLTMRVIRDGMRPIVVGADGIAYGIHDWPLSNTFRQNDQANIVIGDNRTRVFSGLTKENRLVHSWVSWGIFGTARMPGYLDFDLRFPCAAADLITVSKGAIDQPLARPVHQPAADPRPFREPVLAQ